MLAIPMPAAEDEAQDPSVNQPGAQSSYAGELRMKRFPAVLGRNLTANLFSPGNLFPFLIGVTGALVIAPTDQEISQSIRDHAHELGDTGKVAGMFVPASLAGGALLISRLTGKGHFRSFGYTLAQAYATNVILTQGLKYATHRMRPDGSSSNSFPSGHTSDNFAMAAVVSEYYGKKWGLPLYAFAGLVGVSRIEKGRHWPSDIVAGATLGYLAGKSAILGTRRELAGGKITRLMFHPVYGQDLRGLSACLRF